MQTESDGNNAAAIEEEIALIREQREAIQKAIETNLAMKREIQELEDDFNRTGRQLCTVAENAGNLCLRTQEVFRTLQQELRVNCNKKLVVGDFSYKDKGRVCKLNWEDSWYSIRKVVRCAEKRLGSRIDVESSWYQRKLPGVHSTSRYVLLEFNRVREAATVKYLLSAKHHYFPIFDKNKKSTDKRLIVLNYVDVLEEERRIPLLAAQTAFELYRSPKDFEEKYVVDFVGKCIWSRKTRKAVFKIVYSLSGYIPLARCYVAEEFINPIWMCFTKAMTHHYGENKLVTALHIQQDSTDDDNPSKSRRKDELLSRPLQTQPLCECPVVKYGDIRDQTTGQLMSSLYISDFPYAIHLQDGKDFYGKR